MAKLHTFTVGYCTHPACMALKGAGFKSKKFPNHAYLIETRAGFHLWDTGYSDRFHTCAKGIYAPYRWTTPVHYNHESDNLALQLKEKGIAATDIRSIFVSHFHADHMAALADFPKAKFYASMDAIDSIRGKSGLSALIMGFLPGLLPDNFSSRIEAIELAAMPVNLPPELSPFLHGWKVDSGSEFLVVSLPGHAKGHLGAFIQTDTGWELLASDAAWDHRGYKELIGPSDLTFLVQSSRKDYYRTLSNLHWLHRKGNINIHLSHD